MLESIFYGTSFGRDRLSPARIAYLLFIWVVVPMWLVIRFYTMILRMIFTLGLAAYSQSADVNATFREAYFTWTGDIGMRGLSIDPNSEGSTQQRIEVRQILIDMPNWGVIEKAMGAFERLESSGTQSQLDAQALIDNIDHVGVSVEGLQADVGNDVPAVLRHFGMASAAPFEAEGCRHDTGWIQAELANMGIPNRGVDMQLTLSTHSDLGEVHIDGRLNSPGSSRVDFSEHYKASGLFNFVQSMQSKSHRLNSNYDRIEVTDAGFTDARNSFCAKRDGVSKSEFVERHISAIQRGLQAHGVRAGADIERVYRDYLAHGRLLIEAKPSTNVPRSQYDQYSVVDQQRMYNAKISSGGTPVPLMLEEVPIRPIPTGFDGNAWDLVAEESANPDFDGQNPGVASDRILTSTAAPTATPTVPPPSPLPAPLPSLPVTSLPTPTAVGHDVGMLVYDDLGHRIGERLLITTQFGDVRDVTLESYSKHEIEVRVYVTGGYMTQHIERSQIRSIKALD